MAGAGASRPGVPAAATPSRSPVAGAVLVVFAVAVAVRCAMLASPLIPEAWLDPAHGGETGRVARTLALRGAYADPYVVPSGPTAHPLPIYTGLLAAIYRVAGTTLAAGYARALLGILCYAAMYGALPWFTDRVGLGVRAGFLGGMAGALLPQQAAGEVLGYSGNEPLAAIALGWMLVGFLRRWNGGRSTVGNGAVLGVGAGIGLHVAPPLAGVLIGCVAFERTWGRGRIPWRHTATVLVAAALACVPWTVRNHLALGGLSFLRSNFGLELRVANHDGAVADMALMDRIEGDAMRHPGNNAAEARRVAELGEMEYMRRARQEAFAWIRDHPGSFAVLAASRFIHFWFGPPHDPPAAIGITLLTLLAAAGLWSAFPDLRPPQRAVLLIPLLTYPIVYYVVTYMSRYAVPVNWLLLALAGVLLDRWLPWPTRPSLVRSPPEV